MSNRPGLPNNRTVTTNIQTYGNTRDLNEVNGMIKSVERKVSYIPVRGSSQTGQSIYLN